MSFLWDVGVSAYQEHEDQVPEKESPLMNSEVEIVEMKMEIRTEQN